MTECSIMMNISCKLSTLSSAEMRGMMSELQIYHHRMIDSCQQQTYI